MTFFSIAGMLMILAYLLIVVPNRQDKGLSTWKVKLCRNFIAEHKCPNTNIRHRWRYDGYFWYHCVTCGDVR